MKISNDQIEQIIQFLQGTCMNSLNDAVVEICGEEFSEDDLTSENHDQIDNEIFLCDTCGWWCEVSQEADTEELGERICDDCKPDDEENE